MADWFKFYEDFFDNPRFQYAIHQMSEVCPVTVLLLTEHCRHKSDTIAWTGDEIDLLGFSAKINVPPDKIKSAILLLQNIRYITIADGKLTFNKWNDLQSDYCRKFVRRKLGRVQKSPEKSDFVRLEERRGEEIRIEEKRAPAKEASFPEANGSPTLPEVLTQAQMIGLAPWKAEDWFYEMDSCGWVDYSRRKIVNWRSSLTRVKAKWEHDGRPTGPSQQPRRAGTPAQQLKAIEDRISKHKANRDSVYFDPNFTESDREELKTLRASHEQLSKKLSGV